MSLLKKNIGINLFAKILPLLVGVLTLPMIVKGLGVERTGILQIFWGLIGYSSFFDLGLCRALTQLVSRKLAQDDKADLSALVFTSLASITLLGMIPAALLIAGSGPIVSFLHVSPALVDETLRAVFWLAVSIPAMLLITGLTGILQSYQKFDWITWLNMPAIFGNFVAPVLMLTVTHDLGHVVGVMVLCRIAMAMLFLMALNRCLDCTRPDFRLRLIVPLFHFGKWVTVSNIVSPLMVSLVDRLLLSNLFSVLVASYYVVPYGVLQKMTVAPWAIIGVMFPAFSASFCLDRQKSRYYYHKSLLFTVALLAPPVLVVMLFAKPLLSAWMDPDFASHSDRLTQLIALALYFYSINLVPYSLIQAAGRADFTAKLQLAELPLMLAAMYVNIRVFGIMAAPATLLGLFLVEGAIMQWYVHRLFTQPEPVGTEPENTANDSPPSSPPLQSVPSG